MREFCLFSHFSLRFTFWAVNIIVDSTPSRVPILIPGHVFIILIIYQSFCVSVREREHIKYTSDWGNEKRKKILCAMEEILSIYSMLLLRMKKDAIFYGKRLCKGIEKNVCNFSLELPWIKEAKTNWISTWKWKVSRKNIIKQTRSYQVQMLSVTLRDAPFAYTNFNH